jgi:hypothetical protein
MTENILIFGSKPKAAIPLIDVREIFSSNGSAELSLDYFEHVNKVRHTCIIGAKSFLKLEDIKNRVIKSQPNEIIVRDYDKNYRQIDNLFNQETIINKFTKSQQFYYQRNFFDNGIINLLIAEYNYKHFFFEKYKHMIMGLIKYGLLGSSSGFFALLYASKKYPKANLIVSGISFEGGDHFYRSGKMTKSRGSVDNYLINKLKKEIKDRIYILDKDIAKKYNLNYLERKTIKL